MLRYIKVHAILGVSALYALTAARHAYAIQTPGGACPEGKICNPLNSSTIQEFLGSIIDILIVFAMPIIVLFIMYAGFLFVTARGNEGQIEKARSALLWAVVGGVIVLGAKIISEVIEGTVRGL